MRPLSIAVLAAATALITACADENPGLTIGGNLQADDSCGFVPGSSNVLAAGIYDTAIPHSYYVAPLFRSALIARAAVAGPPRAEPNDIQIEGAEVSITDVAGASLGIADYTIAMSAFVPAATDGEAGLAAGVAEAISLSAEAQLAGLAMSAGTVVVTMKFFGHTTGGTAVEATPWSWTVHLCNGCLQAPCSEMLVDQCFAGQDGYKYQSSACPVVP